MKKLALILLVISAASLVYSCKPREKCPAYGQHTPATDQATHNPS